uniref:G-protein coupled receptors family 1 profile domain-containing protein n=1 Tax=Takifugu rubripes TaxID=31033 RepID=A0A674PKY8_TAKRU
MAVSDLLVGLAVMPFMIVTLDSCRCISSFICFLSQLLSFVLTSASVGNMVLISVDRYVAICCPLRYSSITPNTVKICVSVCWTSSIIYNLILLKDNLLHLDFSSSCHKKCPLYKNYILGITDIIITFYGPLTVIIVLYARVFVVAVTQARAMRSQVSTAGSKTVSSMKSELRAARTLGIIILFFLICFFPYYISALILQESNEDLTGYILLFYCNSTINPIVYAFFYPWFRNSVKLIVSLSVQLHPPPLITLNPFSVLGIFSVSFHLCLFVFNDT